MGKFFIYILICSLFFLSCAANQVNESETQEIQTNETAQPQQNENEEVHDKLVTLKIVGMT